MTSMSISAGARIKELRTLAGMSQEELGKRVGVQRAAINKYEVGSVTNIPLTTIEKMAMVFDVSPTYIVGWDNACSNPLSAEVKVLKGVQTFYGKDAVDLLEGYVSMSPTGRKKVLQYLNDMSELHGEQL